MRNLLVIACICLFACNKAQDLQVTEVQPNNQSSKNKQSCDFGITQFNTTKRPTVADEFNGRKGKPLTSTGGGGTTTTTTSGGAVIFLDFDGGTVSKTSWNVYGDFTCGPANLTTTEATEIFNRVSNDYSPFNITVTTSQSVYDAANPYKRTKVMITETYQWYSSGAGGVSYVGSFAWGDNTPCFVFSLLLNYNIKMIAEAVSHEAGHTLGLYHQAKYDANGVELSEYNYGQGSGETGWAPIMGVGYYQNATLWHNGPNPYDYTSHQDDVAIITNAIGSTKSDDYSNTTTNAKLLTGSTDGLINNNGDIDFFYVDNTTTKNISVTPFSVAANNAGANLDLVLRIYNSSGALISTVDNPAALNVTTTLDPGKYYLAVTTTPNQYAGTYGMIGKYSITLQ
jgi:hypothetical protein